MAIVDKHNEEDLLVPILFGELNKKQLYALFPELETPSNKNQNNLVKQILLKRTKSEESQQQIVAWNELRKMNILPDKAIAKKVLGFIIEVGLTKIKGVDYLAVYLDCSARYFNFSGAKIIYENMNNSKINNELQKTIHLSTAIVDKIGVWDGIRRDPPNKGIARINFLTPMGLFFGEGPFNVLGQDVLAKDIVAQSIIVMKLLMELHSAIK